MSIATQQTLPAANGAASLPVNVPRAKPEKLIVSDNGPLAHLMDTARFEHLYRIATIMASAGVLPDHLAGVKKGGQFIAFTKEEIIGTCFQIVNQAFRWGIDPFAVKDETYVVGGKLGYQGKLVAAVINSRSGIVGRLAYSFHGKGDDLTVTVSGTFEGEDEPRTVSLSVAQGKTSNDMWKKDPEQKLVYSGSTKWARRRAPEVMLGVLTDDDLERMAISHQQAERTALPPRNIGALQQQWASEKQDAAPAAAESSGIAEGEIVGPGGEIIQAPAESAADGSLPDAHPLYQLEVALAGATDKAEVTALRDAWAGPDSDPEFRDQALEMCRARSRQLPAGGQKQEEIE